MNRRTTLCAAASDYWLEDKKWLPTERQPLPAELDFNRPQGLPTHWVNNGFEGWDGKAKITWPDHGLSLQIASSDIFQRYFIFVSDTKFDPGYKQDFFCFEPMSHSADGHHQKDLAGLRILEPGQSLSGWVSLRPIFE
jgi:aldose 1-epimerase